MEGIIAGALPKSPGQDSQESAAKEHILMEPSEEKPKLTLVVNNGKVIPQGKPQEIRIM